MSSILLVCDVEKQNRYVKDVLIFPTIKTIPLEFELKNIQIFDTFIFSSKKAVNYFFEKIDRKQIKDKTFIAVGNQTKKALLDLGMSNVIVPEENTAHGIVKFFQRNKDKFITKKILFPRGKKGRTEIIEHLKDFDLTYINVYDTVINIPSNKENIKNDLVNNNIKFVAFTSPLTFKNFLHIFHPDGKKLLKGKLIASIGKTTQKEIEKEGLYVSMVPENPSIENLIDKIRNCELHTD